MSGHWRLATGASLLLLAVFLAGGCDTFPFESNDDFDPASLPNQPPVARISVSDEDSLAATSYNQATFHWSGSDVDGFVQGFHVGIGEGSTPPSTWIFTTQDETTSTYSTDAQGEALPRLYVVAEDDRGALSDTVSTAFPLVNFPPTLEFWRDFQPLAQSFGAASFEFFGFDRDGDETLMPWVEYRFDGADSNVVYLPGDPDADPAAGWVRLDRVPTRFSLQLSGIPAGDPGADYEQTIYVRITDEGGATAILEHPWQNYEVRGEVLVMDDNLTQPTRDTFYADALTAVVGDQFSVWDITGGLPEREDDLWLTISQFRYIVWYCAGGPSANLRAAEGVLRRFVTEDLDAATDGIQHGRLLLENQALVGAASNLTSSFRNDVLGLTSVTDPRNALATYNSLVERDLGPLDILSQDATLPDLVSVGQNYEGGPGRYFNLVGLAPTVAATPLWRFEEYRWGGATDQLCRLGCEPVVAIRRPVSGLATVVSLGFQIEYANASGTAVDALAILLRDHLGMGEGGR